LPNQKTAQEEQDFLSEMEKIDQSLDLNFLIEQQRLLKPQSSELAPIIENSE